MAYVNFGEEKFVANKQLNNRRENNNKIVKTIINDRSKIDLEYDERLSFGNFNKRTFNNSKVENEKDFQEISYKNIVCSEFIKCKFNNMHFKSCIFVGCKFIECDFQGGGVIFENCSFILDEISNIPSLNVKDNLGCEFQNCCLYIKFLNCNISYLIIDECNIKDTNFELTDMTSLIINKSNMKKIDLIDVNMSGTKILDTYIEDLEFNDKYMSKLDEKTFFDKLILKSKTKQEYEGIYKIYETYANQFKNNNLNNNFGEYYFLAQNTQRKSLKPLSKFISYIYLISCGYGERIMYSLITSFVAIIIFAVLYMLFGIDINGIVVRYITAHNLPTSIMGFLKHVNYSMALSVEMFAGLGADIAKPAPGAFIIGNLENIFGVIMIGIGIGTLTRKIIR